MENWKEKKHTKYQPDRSWTSGAIQKKVHLSLKNKMDKIGLVPMVPEPAYKPTI